MGDQLTDTFDKVFAARLRKKEDYLRDHVELERDGVLDRLKTAEILDDHDVQRLQLHNTQRDAWSQLIRILPCKGENACHEFRIALRKANKHDVVLELDQVKVEQQDLMATESESRDRSARATARKWILEELVEAEDESVSLDQIHVDLSRECGDYTNFPSDEDLLDVSSLIHPDLMLQLAIKYLHFDKLEFDLVRKNCEQEHRPKEEFHLQCLVKWREKNGAGATKEALYELLQKASSEGDLLDRSKLTFLKQKSSNVWGIFNITPEELCEMICEIYPGVNQETTSDKKKGSSKTRLHNLKRRNQTQIVYERVEKRSEPDNISRMEDWNIDEVVAWLESIGCTEQVCETFRKDDMGGYALTTVQMEHLGNMSQPISMGMKLLIISHRNKFVEKEQVDKGALDSSPQNPTTDAIQEQLRPFDSTPAMTFKYKESAEVPEVQAGPDDLITPTRKFVDISKILSGNNSIPKICREMVLFICACFNNHTNGTIHFGIKDQKIVGVELGISQSNLNGNLSSALVNAFDQDQHEIVHGCVRTAKFIEVIQSTGRNRSKKFVIEIDVRPDSECCMNGIFYAKAPQPTWKNQNLTYEEPLVYRFNRQNKSEPYALNHQDLKDYQKLKVALVHLRKQREEDEDRKSRNRAHPDLRRKLLEALCHDRNATILPDLYHLCVLSPLNSDVDDSFIKENLDFLGTTEWKAAFDFDSDSKICDHLAEGKQLPIKIIPSPEKFETKKCKPSTVRSLHEDLKNSADLSWIFCNGMKKTDVVSAESAREWKRNMGPSFKECIRFFSREIPDDRAVVVFLLFSKNYDVMLEAADEFCTMFPDQFVCIAENDSIANPWKERLLTMNCVDRDVLDAKTVVGLPWGHVQEIFQSLTDPNLSTKPKLSTTLGVPVTLSQSDRESWSDLDVLASNQCEDCELSEEEYTQQQQTCEEKFYHGEQVSWWNFYFPYQVCERSIHDELKRRVEESLTGDNEDDSKIVKVTLFHEQGSGGTTEAKHVLWDLKKKYRCAVLRDFSEQTSSQILKFRSYKDDQGDPKPVVIMIDNADDDKVGSLLSDLEFKARCASPERSNRPVCVLLVVTRRSKMKTTTKSCSKVLGKYEVLKHELEQRELDWFKKKHLELEGKFKHHEGANPKMMISFNILRENFSKKYIKETTLSLLEAVTCPRERKLLKYLSMLNGFDITALKVPTAAFDKLMKVEASARNQNKHWETGLSKEVHVLLNVSSRQAMRKIQVLSIIHPLFAKEILDASRQEGGEYIQSLSGAVLDLFAEDFVNAPPEKRKNPEEQLHLSIYNILVKRRRIFNTEPETKFSPLIEEILRREDHSKAGEVLQEGFKLVGGAFVAQQVSRYFMHIKKWKVALEYAKKAVEMKGEKPYFLDTLGRVYIGQAKSKLAEFSDRGAGSIPEREITDTMQLCLEAIKHFKKEQEVTLENENEVMGCIGELDASLRMLDCLTCMELFKQGRDRLREFLFDRQDVPPEITHWKNVDGIDYIEELKNLQQNVTVVIGKIEDEQGQHRLDAIDEDEDEDSAPGATFWRFVQLKKNFNSYFSENSDKVPNGLTEEGKRQYRRRRILNLGGYSLGGIYGIKKYVGFEAKLLKIIKHADANLASKLPLNAEDLRFKLTAVLALSTTPNNSYTNKLKLADMIQLSTDLFRIRSYCRPIRLEPYLFYVMFGWPRECTDGIGLPPEQIQDAIGYWSKAYLEKYPRKHTWNAKKDTTLCTYLLANGTDLQSVIDYDQLRNEVGKLKGDEFWHHPIVVSKLQRFKGLLSDGGISVSVQVTCGEKHQGKIKIPTHCPDRKLWNKTVYFVIGFTWMTPKAFDVTQNYVRKQELVSSSIRQNNQSPALAPLPEEKHVLTQAEYWRRLYEIQKELDEIDANGIRAKLSHENRNATKLEENQLKKEASLIRSREKLLNDRVKEIELMNDD